MKLRRNLILAFITIIVLAAGITLAVLIIGCSDMDDISIGEFESKQAALPSAIRALSAEISKCPEAKQYYVSWIASDSNMREAIMYLRESKWLGYEQDCYSGFSDDPYNVDDAAIREVAEKGGTLEDFKEYDHRAR